MITLPRFPLLLLLASPVLLFASEALPLTNPGFEDGANGWRFKESVPMSEVSVDAAYQGEAGLRVDDNDAVQGSQAISGMLTVMPGTRYTISFWARSSSRPPVAGVFVWFYSPEKKQITQEKPPVAMVSSSDGKWRQHSLEITVPDGAGHAALWIHSLSSATGVVDFDEFEIKQSGDGSEPR